jgi:hypothetical protein
MKIKKKKPKEEPMVIQWEDEEAEEDLSWMIQDSDQEETKQNKSKGKK